eukprot:8450481-Alexandrium_andersonii.AAC.1
MQEALLRAQARTVDLVAGVSPLAADLRGPASAVRRPDPGAPPGEAEEEAVSYTHLTLPTICSV